MCQRVTSGNFQNDSRARASLFFPKTQLNTSQPTCLVLKETVICANVGEKIGHDGQMEEHLLSPTYPKVGRLL